MSGSGSATLNFKPKKGASNSINLICHSLTCMDVNGNFQDPVRRLLGHLLDVHPAVGTDNYHGAVVLPAT